MKTIRNSYFFLIFFCIQPKLHAMITIPDSRTSEEKIKAICRHLISQENLVEFKNFGTVLNGQSIEEVIPDSKAANIFFSETAGFISDSIRDNYYSESHISGPSCSIDYNESYIAKQILLLYIIQREDSIKVATDNKYLSEIFSTLSEETQESLNKKYVPAEVCKKCSHKKYPGEFLKTTCCKESRILCRECLQNLSNPTTIIDNSPLSCPFCNKNFQTIESSASSENGSCCLQ